MVEIVLTLWSGLVVGFILGAVWNADAYEHGYRDGKRE